MGNATREKINNIFIYKFLCIILFLILIIQPLHTLSKSWEVFFSRGYESKYSFLKELYENSQYVKKKNPGIIPDQALESFAAGAFLKGINPILVIHDQPPLGRYILSFSILIFDNANTIMVLLFFLSGFGVFLVARSVLNSSLFSLIPFGIFINEPLFLNKFYNSPLLEPIQLPFIIFTLYFFILGVIKKNYIKWFIFSSIMLGFVVSIRFFALGGVLIFSFFAYFLIRKKIDRKFFVFLLSLPIIIIVLLLSYIRTVQLGSSILNIFGIQRYIFEYHKTQLSLPFSFWDLLIFNRWHTWWGTREITFDPHWIIIWPISAFLTFTNIAFAVFKKISISEQEKIIIIWIMSYSFFLSLGESSTRYFPPLLAFLYIVATSFVVKIFYRSRSKYKTIWENIF